MRAVILHAKRQVVDRHPPLEWDIVLYASEVKPSYRYLSGWLARNGWEIKGQVTRFLHRIPFACMNSSARTTEYVEGKPLTKYINVVVFLWLL